MKVILIGAAGRMGRAVASLAAERGDEIVCGVDPKGGDLPFPVYRDLSGASHEADAAIDFSVRENLGAVLEFATARKLPLLLAATGYDDKDLENIASASKEIPILQTGNLSVGVSLLAALAKRAARALGEDFDVEIVERHHNKKKDAPSGTAIMLKEAVEEGRGPLREVLGRAGETGPRKKDEIGIHAVRGGTIVGEHEVMFAGEDEIITLSHSAGSRKIFAAGALRGAAWLRKMPAGLYRMADMFTDL